jgi:hypothetical protein
MSNDILALQAKLQAKGGELRIDHRIVAEGLGQKSHKSWRENILQKYEAEFEGLGGILKMPLDDGSIVWYLTEAQVNFAGALSRNSVEAVKFKYNLVKAFELAKSLLQQRRMCLFCLKAIAVNPKPRHERHGGAYNIGVPS